MSRGLTILERGDYVPQRRCEGVKGDHLPCRWFRWNGRRRVCFYRGDVRRTLKPGAIADFCEYRYEEGE